MEPVQKLKEKVLKGGIYLAVRQLSTAVLSLISVLVIARLLGPKNYGIVAIALGFFYFLTWTSKLGLNVYVTRQPELPKDAPEQILSFYNTLGAILSILILLLAPAFGWWTGQSEVSQLIRWLALPLWLEMVGTASISMLERELRFTQVGLIETIAQVSNYLLAVPLVLMNWSYWGPIAGLVLQCTVYALMARYYYPISLRRRWRLPFIRSALSYGLTFCGSQWIMSLRTLTVPLLVSRLVGVEAAGITSIAIRFVEQLSLLRAIMLRMSISLLAKLMSNLELTRAAISRGMTYQVLVVGPTCAVFSCCAGWLIPLMFGAEWLPSAKLFPLIAVAVLIGSVFDLHGSALYAAGHNREVALYSFGYITVEWLALWLIAPNAGLWSYGVAQIIALPSYFLLHRSLVKLCGSPNYGNAFWLIIVTLPALIIGPLVPVFVGIGVLILSYGAIFLFVESVRKVPVELYFAWRSRKADASS
jgi:PST family polysaccharide transporter